METLLSAKAASGKTFNEISCEIGVTNAYCAQLFLNQAQLRGGTAAKLKAAVPQLRCAPGGGGALLLAAAGDLFPRRGAAGVLQPHCLPLTCTLTDDPRAAGCRLSAAAAAATATTGRPAPRLPAATSSWR